ncbi:MAG: dihydroorotase [Deinococcota bacterium]
MSTDSITLNAPLDMHLHLRQGKMLERVAAASAAHFAGAVIMPNLVPPVDSLDALLRYKDEVLAAIGASTFIPYMTLFFRDYSEAELQAAKPHIIGIKLYPAGVTTNSEAGTRSIDDAKPTFARMEALGIPLLVHGETSGFVLDREREFVGIYDELAREFPKLKIIMEHITTADAVAFLDTHPNVFATITVHHLLITLDDVAGGLLQPHLFCKPIAKRPEDRRALLDAALNAHPKVMFGSDSAPHPRHAKEACGCAAGVFSAPMALACLTELFDYYDALDNLQAFISGNAQRIYKLTPVAKHVTLNRQPWTVPTYLDEVTDSIDAVRLFKAADVLSWQVSSLH